MYKEIVINVAEYGIRVAVMENNKLMEVFIDQENHEKLVGNIYTGRVTSILPGIDAAFVDIGLDRNAFLYVSDVASTCGEYEEMMGRDYNTGYDEDEIYKIDPKPVSIEDMLRINQTILVQVVKEPLGNKGPRVTSHIAFPGRYLVLTPTVSHIGVSRRIEDDEERERLRELIERIRPSNNIGFIVRTEGEGKCEEDFLADMNFLLGVWQRVKKRAAHSPTPYLLHRDLDIIFRTIRDLFTESVDRLIVDSPKEYERIVEFLSTCLVNMVPKVHLYDKKEPIFEAYGIEKEIESSLKRKIWLKSGGFIAIDQTEALVAIDVNSGRNTSKRNPEETALSTNLEAVDEICRQLRLRDIGGIIVIDFIDMSKKENRRAVLKALEEALKRDRSQTKIVQFTELGLVEMTRKRARKSLSSIVSQPCPYCEGRGVILSDVNMGLKLERELTKACSNHMEEFVVHLHPMSLKLITNKLSELEGKLGRRWHIQPDERVSVGDVKIVSILDTRR
ncbi:MAG: Rne/Rng family ribonuclease [bacterium]